MEIIKRFINKITSIFIKKNSKNTHVTTFSKNNIVYKDNKFNIFTPFNSVIQLKLLSLFLVEIRNNPNIKSNTYKIKVDYVLKEFEIDKKNIKRTKILVDSMTKSINLTPENNNGFDFAVLFTRIKTEDNTYWEFTVNDLFKPYILNTKGNYTKYFLNNISLLSGTYSFRMYEILKQFESSGWLSIRVEELRKRLDIKEGQHKAYKHFKLNILTHSQREIQEKTDIYFTFEEFKEKKE